MDTPQLDLERRLRILLVDDHPDTLRAMTRILNNLEYDVSPAADVKDALAAAEGGGLDVLISDLDLPDGTGFDLMAHLRSQFPGKAIALSGFDMDEDVQRCKDAGFARCLTKPVSVQLLQETIQGLAC